MPNESQKPNPIARTAALDQAVAYMRDHLGVLAATLHKSMIENGLPEHVATELSKSVLSGIVAGGFSSRPTTSGEPGA